MHKNEQRQDWDTDMLLGVTFVRANGHVCYIEIPDIGILNVTFNVALPYILNSPLPFRSAVRVVSSTRAGMGKTLFITRMAEKLDAGDKSYLIIPIHGPYVTIDSVMKYLLKHQDNCSPVIVHFDISPLVNDYCKRE